MIPTKLFLVEGVGRHRPRDANADPARIAASFENGILTIKVPRSEEAKPAVIAIE